MEAAGIEVVWANEIKDAACTLYERVTKNPIEQGDIRRIDSFPDVDILCGCYPCQGYSQGGARRSNDNINFLYREFDRVLRAVRPLAFIVENVDGMRFSQNAPLLRAQLVRFRSAGYSVAWKIINAVDFGLAQHRKRLFMVGIQSKEKLHYSFPSPITSDEGGKVKSRTQRDVIYCYRDAPPSSYCDDPFHWYYLSRNRWRAWDEPARCVVSHWRHVGLHPDSPQLRKVGKDNWEFVDGRPARRLSYIECAALQGFPDPTAFDGVSVRKRFEAIGNAVPPPLFEAVATRLVELLSK